MIDGGEVLGGGDDGEWSEEESKTGRMTARDKESNESELKGTSNVDGIEESKQIKRLKEEVSALRTQVCATVHVCVSAIEYVFFSESPSAFFLDAKFAIILQ